MQTILQKTDKYKHDISYYAEDGRLTEPSDGRHYRLRDMIEFSQKLCRPLTEEEAETFRIKSN